MQGMQQMPSQQSMPGRPMPMPSQQQQSQQPSMQRPQQMGHPMPAAPPAAGPPPPLAGAGKALSDTLINLCLRAESSPNLKPVDARKITDIRKRLGLSFSSTTTATTITTPPHSTTTATTAAITLNLNFILL
jgi:hypothetical protein